VAGEPETPPPAVTAAIFGIGDSITTTSVDTVDAKGWVGHLVDAIGTGAAEQPLRIARGGADIYEISDFIVSDLSWRTLTPHKVCILIGANDIEDSHGWPQDEAVWKAAYQNVIDVLHAKWSSAKIYLGKSFRDGAREESNMVTIHAWIDDLVAANPGLCYAGINTTLILNDHPELHDGVHPNHDGCVAIGNAWKALLYP
jgi:lysophospholipase L1-like esterase